MLFDWINGSSEYNFRLSSYYNTPKILAQNISNNLEQFFSLGFGLTVGLT
jgi:hypothetical protein